MYPKGTNWISFGLIGKTNKFPQERKHKTDSWYIPPRDITDTHEVLGRGNFGLVTKGYHLGTPVALKHPLDPNERTKRISVTSRASGDDASSSVDNIEGKEDREPDETFYENLRSGGLPTRRGPAAHPLQKELSILVHLRHPSIVQTLGATFINNKMVVILQYMKHDTIRSILDDTKSAISTAMLSLEVQWALQIASGMAFLHNYPTPIG